MIEYAKIVLWGVSFEKRLFRKELHKIASWCDSRELLSLKKYCYEKYYEMFPEIVDEVFAHRTKAYILLKTHKDSLNTN